MQHQKYKIQPFIYHSSGAKRRVVGLRSEEFPGPVRGAGKFPTEYPQRERKAEHEHETSRQPNSV